MNGNLRVLAALLLVLSVSGLCVTLHFGFAETQTQVIGIIHSDTTWTKANSPYQITGPVGVPSGVTLTIEAGANVTSTSGYIQVNGSLRAEGTIADPINLQASIRFTESSSNWSEQTQTGCIIEYSTVGGIDTFSASPKITHCTINIANIRGGAPLLTDNNFTNRLTVTGGSPVISRNVITSQNELDALSVSDATAVISNNTVYGGIGAGDSTSIVNNTVTTANLAHGRSTTGINCGGYGCLVADNVVFGCDIGIHAGGLGGSVAIERNAVVNNAVEGIHISNVNATVQKNTIVNNSVGISALWTPNVTIKYNNIMDNEQNSLTLAYTANDYDATENWWGTTDAQAINQSIIDSKYDFTLGTVHFVPYLTAPNPEAPAVPTLPSPSSSPAVVELQFWIVLPLMITAALIAVAVGRKNVYARRRS